MAPANDQSPSSDGSKGIQPGQDQESDSEPARPFGVTLLSVALGFWGLLYAAVGLNEPTMSGTIVTGIGMLAILLAVGLFIRHPIARPAGILTLAVAVLWFGLGTISGRPGAPLGAVGACIGAIYLYSYRTANKPWQ